LREKKCSEGKTTKEGLKKEHLQNHVVVLANGKYP